jgi:ERO1-like protein alpha
MSAPSLIVLALLVGLTFSFSTTGYSPNIPNTTIDDCCLSMKTVSDSVAATSAVLQNLTKQTYFKFFQVNYERDCEFWPDDFVCTGDGETSPCSICECDENDVPLPFRTAKDEVSSASSSRNSDFSASFLVPQNLASTWTDYDEKDPGNVFIDLQKNPEKFTGFSGAEAMRIWKAIYLENCFTSSTSLADMCREERIFFRLISGFHASITAHVAESFHYNGGPLDLWQWKDGYSAPHMGIFLRGLGYFPDRVRNLYFSYAFVAAAFQRMHENLLEVSLHSGDDISDEESRKELRQLLDLLEDIPFASTTAWSEGGSITNGFSLQNDDSLNGQLRKKFLNISKILDCVGCQTCKVHSKLQMLGIGSALKIIVPDQGGEKGKKVTLLRNEVIALVNTLAKLAESIEIVQSFDQHVTQAKLQTTIIWYSWILVSFLVLVALKKLVMA